MAGSGGRLARELGCARVLVVSERCAEKALEGLAASAWSRLTLLAERPVACPDLRVQANELARAGRLLAVDVTAVTQRGCAAVRLGAALALDRQGDGSVLVALAPDALELPELSDLVADAAADDTLEAAAERLDERYGLLRRASDEAQVVASYLACHPGVCAVSYPGLKGDASFTVAARTLVGGFGPVVDYRLACVEDTGLGNAARRRSDPDPGCSARRSADGGPWHRVRCRGADPRDTIMGLERALADTLRGTMQGSP